MRKHYHVMSSMPGCLPDSNDVYPAKKDAQDGLRWHRDHVHEYVSADCPSRVFGSIRSGLIVHEYGNYGSQQVYELFPCTDPDCLSEED
jgi:hypothetical protein